MLVGFLAEQLRVRQQVATMRRWPLVLAWAATIAAVLSSVWIAFRPPRGAIAAYDPIVALTMLSVVAIVWYTYLTRETLEHARASEERSREQQRKALATAVLAELWSVIARLRVLRNQGPGQMSPEILTHPITTLAASSPMLFQSKTVQSFAIFLRQVEDVQHLLSFHPELVARARDETLDSALRQVAENRRVETMQSIRIRAAWSHNSCVTLVERLKEEGGELPVGLDAPTVSIFDIPKVLPDPYGRADDKPAA